MIVKFRKIASKYILQSGEVQNEQTFRREWESLKVLSHPNIIQVYELGEEMFCGKPHYVIKMEYCSRESLRQGYSFVVLESPF